MRMKLWYMFFLGCVLLSCTEDLGNYKYRDLIEPEITGIDKDISVLSYDRLQLSPELGEYDFPADRYSFEWKVIASDGEQSTTVIGRERELDYEVELLPGSYTLFFTVTENSTGIYWQGNYHLQVNQATSEGWMVLCLDEEKGRLDMVSAVTGITYRDLLKNNGMPQLTGPRRILWLGEGFTEEDSPFYLLGKEGSTRLGKNNFEWKQEYSLYYEMGGGKAPEPSNMVQLPGGKMMVDGSNAYYTSCWGGIVGLYGSPVNKTFSVAPGVGYNASTANIIASVVLLYDLDHKCFMAYGPDFPADELGNLEPLQDMNDLAGIVTQMFTNGQIKAGVVGTAFGDFPYGYDYVYMENTRYDPGNGRMGVTYTILADGNKRYVYGIQLGDMLTYGDCTYVIGKAYYGDISNCMGITQAEHYAFSSLRNCLYYAVGSTVYRVNLSSPELKAEPQFTLSGETISCLKFNLYKNPQMVLKSYDLIVGTKEGNLRIYEGYSNDGDFRSVEPVLYSGFAGIVDVTYRELMN